MREFFDYFIVNESMIELVVLSLIGLTAVVFIVMLAIKK
jgi:F0F1-type ATP synthase assembly protein I